MHALTIAYGHEFVRVTMHEQDRRIVGADKFDGGDARCQSGIEVQRRKAVVRSGHATDVYRWHIGHHSGGAVFGIGIGKQTEHK